MNRTTKFKVELTEKISSKRTTIIKYTLEDLITGTMWDKERHSHKVLGQYTGWRDSKITKEFPAGEEICEGDILKDANGTLSVVVWEDGGFAVRSPGSESVDWEHGSFYEKCEIVGSIHQNPELLQNGEK